MWIKQHRRHAIYAIAFRSEAQELRSAKQFVEQQLQRPVAAMVGHSKGATDVLLYAARYDDVPCVVNLAARYDLQGGVVERFGPEVMRQLDTHGKVGVIVGVRGVLLAEYHRTTLLPL